MTDFPDLPNGWSWWSGTGGDAYYTRWFGTEYRVGGDLIGLDGSIGGFEGEMYWDEGNKHTVQIRPVTGTNEDDDPITGYPTLSRQFDTEQEAADAVPGMIQLLKKKARE